MYLNFISDSAELHTGSSISYENTLFGNYFLTNYIVKRILISCNCFSVYTYMHNIFCAKEELLRMKSYCHKHLLLRLD